MVSPPDAVDLEERTSAADEAAFAAFYNRTSAGLWRYLRRVSGDSDLAEDLVQESFVKLLLHPAFDGDERQRTGYLYRIATNLLTDRWRRRQVEDRYLAGRPAEAQHAGSGAERAHLRHLRHDMDAVLGHLQPRQRAMLWLAHVEGYDHREIAAIVGVSAASVRVLLFRARRRLAKLLKEYGAHEEDLNDAV